jgi:hypothetical protein
MPLPRTSMKNKRKLKRNKRNKIEKNSRLLLEMQFLQLLQLGRNLIKNSQFNLAIVLKKYLEKFAMANI